jgi:hypothetical protein
MILLIWILIFIYIMWQTLSFFSRLFMDLIPVYSENHTKLWSRLGRLCEGKLWSRLGRLCEGKLSSRLGRLCEGSSEKRLLASSSVSVRPSVNTKERNIQLPDFRKNLYLRFLIKFVEKRRFCLKSDKQTQRQLLIAVWSFCRVLNVKFRFLGCSPASV